ncbi:MAG: chemotaxis response regulator protein-glutamate methylesterase [Spirochaetales bacterium]|nr:chemotaxis response regulator protein-glutamate methylesterase [Spirochaetales bacterium]
MEDRKIKVMVVDDSALVRQVFRQILAEETDMDLMGTASDPIHAAGLLRSELPDVMILDLEMPRMDGLSFLQRIMQQNPIPVIICSSLVQDGSDTLFAALHSGAVDVIAKPQIGTRERYLELQLQIADAIRAASRVNPATLRPMLLPEKKYSADVILPAPQAAALRTTTDKIVAIAASTGGTQAISELLQELRSDAPAIVIVQHMPEHFTRMFADRLNALCAVNVSEAADQDALLRGHAYIAPGNSHLTVERSGARYLARIVDGPLVNRHRPSADVLFRSVAQQAGSNAIGILLTGMGDDGARGLLEMRKAGIHTIAQDEATSVVFGMPREAIELGAACKVLPLAAIVPEIIAHS